VDRFESHIPTNTTLLACSTRLSSIAHLEASPLAGQNLLNKRHVDLPEFINTIPTRGAQPSGEPLPGDVSRWLSGLSDAGLNVRQAKGSQNKGVGIAERHNLSVCRHGLGEACRSIVALPIPSEYLIKAGFIYNLRKI